MTDPVSVVKSCGYICEVWTTIGVVVGAIATSFVAYLALFPRIAKISLKIGFLDSLYLDEKFNQFRILKLIIENKSIKPVYIHQISLTNKRSATTYSFTHGIDVATSFKNAISAENYRNCLIPSKSARRYSIDCSKVEIITEYFSELLIKKSPESYKFFCQNTALQQDFVQYVQYKIESLEEKSKALLGSVNKLVEKEPPMVLEMVSTIFSCIDESFKFVTSKDYLMHIMNSHGVKHKSHKAFQEFCESLVIVVFASFDKVTVEPHEFPLTKEIIEKFSDKLFPQN